MQKLSRLLAIEKIIQKEKISSQEILLKKLEKKGFRCTQATLSRNLRQLGVVKVPDGKGGYVYSIPSAQQSQFLTEMKYDLINVIKSIIEANSMIIIKTSPGYANSIAVTIDNYGRYEIAGTIAGDDTLLVIPRDNVSLSHVRGILEMIFPGLQAMAGK